MSFAKCQWAACSRLAAVMEDGWYHCGRHLREHREQRDHTTRDTPIREQVPVMHALGLTDVQMAAKVGTDRGYIATIRRELGLPAHQPPVEGHRTRWGYQRHKAALEAPCSARAEAERVYQRDRARSRRAKAKAA